jgi:4,5-dihydroxyphthalate decarboxylase
MSRRILTAAFGEYDRTWPLRSGDIRVVGAELDLEFLEPGDIFRRMCDEQAFDVSEMSLGAHCHLTGSGESPFVGIPAFPSRAFRHAMVLVHDAAGIREPSDLNGKRIGIREWGMTAVVWIVGILAEHHGFDIASARWVAQRPARVPMALPEGVEMQVLGPGQDLVSLLEAGDLDAALLLSSPASMAGAAGPLRYLFEDPAAEERAWHRRTGLHPLMHTVVMRRTLHAQQPELAPRIYQALCRAREHAMERLADTGVLSAMLPFMAQYVSETRTLFGEDYWPYGIRANQGELEALLRYAHQQALTPRLLEPRELFAEEFAGS